MIYVMYSMLILIEKLTFFQQTVLWVYYILKFGQPEHWYLRTGLLLMKTPHAWWLHAKTFRCFGVQFRIARHNIMACDQSEIGYWQAHNRLEMMTLNCEKTSMFPNLQHSCLKRSYTFYRDLSAGRQVGRTFKNQ